MNRKHAKTLLLTLQHKTMGEVATFLVPDGTEEQRTSLIRCVASLEAHLQRVIAEPTPIDNPGDSGRCTQTREMSV